MNFVNTETGKQLTPVQVKDLWNKGKITTLPYSFGDYNLLTAQILFYMADLKASGIMVDGSLKKIEKSYKKLMNPETNPTQRARCVYDIARYDLVIMIMIGHCGNTDLPEVLEKWKPKLGRNWLLKSMNEISKSDMQGNMYWHFEAEKIYGEAQTLLQAPRVKDIEIQVLETNSLAISYNGNTDVYKFSELDAFWDSRSNCPNVNAHIMIDLSNAYDGMLKANNKYHKTFGRKADANKQLSKLCKALDSVVTTDNLDLTSTNRWFVEKNTVDKQWKPKFKFIHSRTLEEMKLTKDIIDKNMKVSDIAVELSQKQRDMVNSLKMNDSGEVISDRNLEYESKKAEKEQSFTE